MTHAKIGPKGNRVISNIEVAPDGFSRIAALANGAVDGGLISGNKGGFYSHGLSHELMSVKGDVFEISVVNNLTENTKALQSASIVRDLDMVPTFEEL